jgi:phospholipase C
VRIPSNSGLLLKKSSHNVRLVSAVPVRDSSTSGAMFGSLEFISPQWEAMPVWQRSEQRRVQRFYAGSDEKFAGVRPRPDLEPGTDLLPAIEHIVVLMMENHSFDNYFGMLGKGDGLPRNHVTNLPTTANRRVDGTEVGSFEFEKTTQLPHAPTQSWHASHIQYDDDANDGFVQSVELTVEGASPEQIRAPMGYWTDAHLPFYAGLARTFPLADHWFSSCLGPTFPNRRFLIAGTADGLIDDLPFGMVGYPQAGTIFDLLTRNGISWANYHDVKSFGVKVKRTLGTATLVVVRRLLSVIGKVIPTLLHSAIGNLQFTADLYPLGLASAHGHLHSLQEFFCDVDEGTLPSFSIVDPNFSKFSEENAQDVQAGEAFAAEVITRVMRGKNWNKTVLIWVYDEPGGYYDHVSPPSAPPPDGVQGHSLLQLPEWVKRLVKPLLRQQLKNLEAIDSCQDLAYDRYGFRVPAVIVSPFSRPDFTDSTVYDHTSILKLLQEKWNLPPLTRRDAAAASPMASLDLDNPHFAYPPNLPPSALRWTWD